MADRFGLDTSRKKLRQKWEQTEAAWNDPVSRNFEKMFLVPLADQGERTVRALERLTDVIDQARHLEQAGESLESAQRQESKIWQGISTSNVR